MAPADFDPIETPPSADRRVDPSTDLRSDPPAPRSPWPALGVAALLVAAGAGVWFYLGRQRAEPPAAPPRSPSAPGASAPAAVAPAPAEVPPPRLDTSDELLRELLGPLAPRPELARWLAEGDDLVRRGVGAVLAVSEGGSPRRLLAPLAPEGAFAVYERDGRYYVDPRGYARYEPITAVFTALDLARLTAAWNRLAPLVDAAFAEIAYPGRPFSDALGEAVRLLIATPIPEGEVEVVPAPTPGIYRFRDPALENASAAEKHLLRMGPDNARRIQAKLAELAAALGIPATTVPNG